MKKSKLTLALLAGLFSTVALAGCNEVTTGKDGAIITFTQSTTGETVSITADELLKDYGKNSTGISKYYDAITEVLVRNLFATGGRLNGRMSEVEKATTNDVNADKQTASDNADTNGTSYDEELEKILTSHNCEDLDDLYNYHEYLEMKTIAEDDFYDERLEELKVGNAEDGYTGYLDKKLPYHVRHILVKVSASSSAYYNGEISETEANNISSVIKRLATRKNNENFGTIANTASEDTGSAAEYGDLGIMDRDTSYVNEFKLGLYAYDAIFSGRYSQEQKDKLELTDSASDYFTNNGLAEIPYEAALELGDYSKIVKDTNNLQVNENQSFYYPRNVVFNKYFNRHNIAVITPNSVSVNNIDPTTGKIVGTEDYKGTYNATYASLPGFQQVDELGGKTVLCDEKGNVILAVRAGSSGDSGYQGIHFIVAERSALDVDANAHNNYVPLSDYYTTEIPGSSAYPKYDSSESHPGHEAGEEMPTFVNYLRGTSKDYKSSADTVKDKIKSFDKSINTRMFEVWFDEQSVTIHEEAGITDGLATTIQNYISNTRTGYDFDSDLTYSQTWDEYIEKLELQDSLRSTRLLSETCAVKYLTGNAADNAAYQIEGGACYYAK